MGNITIDPQKLAELIEELDSYKGKLASNNEEMVSIKQSMDYAFEGDTEYEDVGQAAIQGIINVNEEVITLLNDTLKDLDAWLEAVRELLAMQQGQMM